MTLADAAETIVSELEKLARWEADQMADLDATRGRRTGLARLAAARLEDLPEPARTDLRLRLQKAAILSAAAMRESPHVTDKVEAVHRYLAQSDGTVTVKEVQAHLEQHGLAPYPDAAAATPSRKRNQGVVRRVGRGRYRVI